MAKTLKEDTTVIQFHMPTRQVLALRALAAEKGLAQAIVFRDVMTAGIATLEGQRKANGVQSIYLLPPPPPSARRKVGRPKRSTL